MMTNHVIPSVEGKYNFTLDEAYAIAWLYKNPCLKMRFVDPTGKPMSTELFKKLCDYRLAHEATSYRFVLTDAGYALYFFKVLTAEQRNAHHKLANAFYDTIADLSYEEKDEVDPHRLGAKARNGCWGIFTNPYTEDGYLRDSWHQGWIDTDRYRTRDGTWEGIGIYGDL